MIGEPHPGPWRPGLNAIRAIGAPAWRPCLTRARGEDGQALAFEHAWFLEDNDGGSLYCHTCRLTRPRVVIGPSSWIARIRAALDAGKLAQVSELVQLGPHSAPLQVVQEQRVHAGGAGARGPSAIVNGAVDHSGRDVIRRDLKPSNVPIFEITIVCESVRKGCEFRALFYDRACQQHFGGSGPTPFEAVAWAFDEYIARVVHGMPIAIARRSTDTPGSRFAALLETRKAA